MVENWKGKRLIGVLYVSEVKVDSHVLLGYKNKQIFINFPRFQIFLGERGGTNGIFQGLAGLLQRISRGQSQPEENPVLLNSFTQDYILFQIGFFNFPK